ncbi:MAG: DinB family protein [Chloroflexi bacterium]|nr:DinB family protein [Chloroflexota bacterium]
MAERIKKAKAELEAARQRLNQVLDAVGERTETPVYADGAAWNVRQLAIHLADADRGHNNQIKGIAEGREVIPADFDLERYNKRSVEKRAEMTLAQARESLNSTRSELNAWLDAQDEAVLDKTGRHASMKIMSIAQILDNMAEHERAHADDIARVLGI